MSKEEIDFTIVYMNGFYDGEKKWKDKIRNKIKELEEKKTSDFIRAVKIIALEDLLKE